MSNATATSDETLRQGANNATEAPHEPRTFARRFPPSRRGAQLARQRAVRQLEQWGHPPSSDVACAVSLLVGELAANAAHHGRVPGRDFQLSLEYRETERTLRIEVADANPEPPPACPEAPDSDNETGRGLLIIDTLATRWGSSTRDPIGKTVWCDYGW